MANYDNTINLNIEGASLEAGVKAVGSLEKTVSRLSAVLTAAFAGEQFAQMAKSAGVLQKELLVLRLAFGKLKVAIARAFAPIGQVVLPMINDLIFAAIRAVKYIGNIIAGLFGVESVSKAVSKAAEKTTRTLAGFDQIQRVGNNTDSLEESAEHLYKLSLEQKLIVSKIKTLLDPLKKIDLSAAISAFGKLKEAIAPLTKQLFSGLEWVWYNIFVPMAKWSAESFLPNFLELLAAAMGALNQVIQAVKPHAIWLWEEYLQPLGKWAGEAVITAMQNLTQKLNGLGLWISENQPLVESITKVLLAFMAVWVAGKIAHWLKEATPLSGFLSALTGNVTSFSNAFSLLGPAATAAWSAITGVFSGAGEWFKNIFNGVLSLFNGVLASVAQGMNHLVSGINSLGFTVPDWIPGMGGQSMGFALKSVSMPTIPLLAQGAVLPANKPFMAVVGDQKNGTNIEAPLTTIQEAVALVMEDQTAALMAGFEASVGVQQKILQAVLGIRIGDEVIARAAERYQRKMAVVRGGRV